MSNIINSIDLGKPPPTETTPEKIDLSSRTGNGMSFVVDVMESDKRTDQ